MKLKKISELFDLKYWVNLELINLNQCDITNKNTLPFVSRTGKNNWISAFVEKIIGVKSNQGHTLSVATWGSILSTFYQWKPYYSGRDLYILIPKKELSVIEMLFYAKCISMNKYRYNYWRQANKTLKDILIPEMPEDWKNIKVEWPSKWVIISENIDLTIDKWEYFKLWDIFDIEKWRETLENEYWTIPLVSATRESNWVSDFIVNWNKKFSNNVITVSSNGSIWEAFYQNSSFYATWDINILKPKFKLNRYIALFLTTIIRQEQYRFNYWRKWGKEKMEISKIKLPTKNWKPDFDFMEDYIKSLPYSYNL
jgi:hypothetical protein